MEFEGERLSRRTKWLLAANAVMLRFEQFSKAFDRKFNPGQPRIPAGQPDGGQWTSDVGAAIQLVGSRRISQAKQAECEAQRTKDEFQCRMVGLRACWAQAYQRYANCLQDLPIPPLNY